MMTWLLVLIIAGIGYNVLRLMTVVSEHRASMLRLEDEVSALRKMLTSPAQNTNAIDGMPQEAPPAVITPSHEVALAAEASPVSETDTSAAAFPTPEQIITAGRMAASLASTLSANLEHATQPTTPDSDLTKAVREDAVQAQKGSPTLRDAIFGWLTTGNLVAKIGLVILFLGVAFLVKFVAQTVTVPIEVRLAAVAAGAIALLSIGFRARTTRPGVALPLQGTAIAILMMVVFAAFSRYDLISPGAAFSFLLTLTGFACGLAIQQNSFWLASFGITGGFAIPLLVSTGQGNHIALFAYYALLNAGVFAIALMKAWRPLNLISFGFTFLVAAAWGVSRYKDEYYASAQAFLILFFLFYVGIALAYARQQQTRLGNYVDATLVLGTPVVAFGLQAGLVSNYPYGLAVSALCLSTLYLTLGHALLRRGLDKWRVLVEAYLAVGVVFGTLAIPLALDAKWTAAAWALEGAGFVWLALRRQHKRTWDFGILLQIAAGLSFLGAADVVTNHISPLTVVWKATWGAFTSMRDSSFLGAIILAASALASSFMMRRVGLKQAPQKAAAWLLIASMYWWFGPALTIAGESISRLLSPDTSQWTYLIHAITVAASTSTAIVMARRLQWPELRWLARFSWAKLVALLFIVLYGLYANGQMPEIGIWAALLVLIAGSEHLLRDAADKTITVHPKLYKFVHTARFVGTWLAIWPAGAILIGRWLSPGTNGSAMATAGNWTAGTPWDNYLPVWVMMAVLAGLIRTTTTGGWPAAPLKEFYEAKVIPGCTALIVWLAFAWNIRNDGSMEPLPYLPVINPLDLTSVFALALALVVARRSSARAAAPDLAWTQALRAAAVAAYGWFNLMLCRSAAQFLEIPYAAKDLLHSQPTQAMLSLVWSATAVALMVMANRGRSRAFWTCGAALLAVVVAKLFVVDLASNGSVARIISFVGVGVLTLLVGFLAPYPKAPSESLKRIT